MIENYLDNQAAKDDERFDSAQNQNAIKEKKIAPPEQQSMAFEEKKDDDVKRMTSRITKTSVRE